MLEDRKKLIQAKKDEALVKQEKEVAKFKEHVNTVLGTESGLAVMGFLFRVCGYDKSSLSIKPDGSIISDNMLYNEARRDVWIKLRAFASPDLLAKIEYVREEK